MAKSNKPKVSAYQEMIQNITPEIEEALACEGPILVPIEPTLDPIPVIPEPAVTGVTYGIRAIRHQGFSSFEIVTFFLVNGHLVHIEYSQPYASFEAIARFHILIDSSVWNLQANYQNGRLFRMGGEQRDALVKKLKAADQHELLAKIEPALRF